MTKTGKCSITASVCDITNGTVLVTDRVKVPETNLDMNLAGKELCRYGFERSSLSLGGRKKQTLF